MLVGAGVLWIFWVYGKGLPDYQQLANYEPPVVTRVHAGNGALLAEYASEKRLFVPVEAIPPRLIQAFISAEDKAFYDHFGVDLRALARAVITNIVNYGSGRRPVGASTITQQVTKNFLLTNEVSIDRKIKEAILSLRMERAFTKVFYYLQTFPTTSYYVEKPNTDNKYKKIEVKIYVCSHLCCWYNSTDNTY